MRLVTKTLALFMAAGLLAGCAGTEKNAPLKIDNALTPEEIAAGIFTPEVLWKMRRVGETAVSPDGGRAVYTISDYSVEENRGVTSLYILPVGGGDAVQLTDNAGNDTSPAWNQSGDRIYFLSDRSGDGQIWTVNPDGKGLRQFSDVEGGIEGFGVAPSGDKLFYVKGVKVEKRESAAIYADMDKSKALIYDDLMARHWNYWDRGEYMHIFIASITSEGMQAGQDIMPGEPWDAPISPYFDMAEIAWNNAGTQLAYTCKKMTGTRYATSTDSDIYLYDLATAQTVNICKSVEESNPTLDIPPRFVGYDKYPVFSPDDRKIAFMSMKRDGHEADKERLMVFFFETGGFADLTRNFDSHAQNILWRDNDNLLFISPLRGTHQICTVQAVDDPRVTVLTSGDHDVNSLSLSGGAAVASISTIATAADLYRYEDGALTRLTDVNRDIYDNITFGEVQKRWIKSSDGKEVLTWVTLPPNFDPDKKYPALLYCEGGPQSTLGWSFRWNFQLMAAQGYVVVAPARRGVPGFGQEWIDQISGDYSGQNIDDLLAGIDAVAKEPWVESQRLGCVGASYGGYTAYFLMGRHGGRFKAFISHCGIYDFEAMYGHTEELFFVNQDYGGPYWDKDNKVAQRSYAYSPHRFAQNWDTPLLIITGMNDFRIPYTQSLEAFTAARAQGVDARLVVFENEAHQVFKPQNSMVWNREFFGWLDKYLK